MIRFFLSTILDVSAILIFSAWKALETISPHFAPYQLVAARELEPEKGAGEAAFLKY